MQGRLILGVLFVVALNGGPASASGNPYLDQAETIACPAAPPGWFNPGDNAGGRTILTPLTPVVQPDGPTEFFSAPVVEVDCHYRTTDGKNLEVSVRYALPIDINPWNDFYIGCTITGHPQSAATAPEAFNTSERTYRVVGKKTWSLATFIDDLNQVDAGDVPRFEAIADSMLEAAQRFAHDCKLAGGGAPVEIRSLWTFSFDATTSSGGITSSGRTTGSFITTADASGGSVGGISHLTAGNFRLTVSGRANGSFELHVAGPIDFRHGYGSILRAHLLVLSSSAASCEKGATGTLIVSVQYLTPPSVEVKLCGQTYLDGKGRVSAQLKTV